MNVAKIVRGLRNHMRRLVAVALDRVPAGRQMTVFPEDIFIVSYPRSGNTWTRFLIGNLIYPDTPVMFSNVEYLLPSIYVHSDRKLLKLPRIFKSHDCFDPRYKTVICIVRDPRDVAVSAYHYSIKVKLLPDRYPIEEFVPIFMSGRFGSGLLADARWGAWHDNVASWIAMRHNRKFLLLRYEDILEDPARELNKVASFLNLPVGPEGIKRAVDLSSADQMRKLEKSQSSEWTLTKETRQDKPFVRNAKAGDWRSALPEKCVEEIEAAWGPLMKTLGYEITSPSLVANGSPGKSPQAEGLISNAST